MITLKSGDIKEVSVALTLKLANIYGVITFRETGAPLEWVRVSVAGRITYSNSSGAYRIENLTPGTYPMTLEKEGYEPLWDTVKLVGGDNEINAEMTLVPALIASLRGYIIDSETGGAIVGAEVTVVELTDFMEANVYKTTSGYNGVYSLENMLFENSPIVVDISVEAAGYDLIKLKDMGLAEGENVKNFEMTIPPPVMANFRGKVVDAPTDTPLEGVLVSMNGLATYTGSDGWFDFTNITAKRYTIELSKEGYEPKVLSPYTLIEGDNEYPAPISMIRIEVYAARLFGYITDNETGEPVADVSITVYQDYDTKTATYRAITDESGFYEMTDMIPEVSADMVIYAGGYETFTRTSIPIAEGDNQLNIVLVWAGGPRVVPRLISYSLPPEIVSGSMFPASMRVWLPYQNYLFGFRLQLDTKPPALPARLTIYFKRMLPASLWDRCNEYTKGKYTRFDAEGEYLLEAMVEAVHRPFWSKYADEPLPSGIYEVSVDVHRQVVEITPNGGLKGYGSEAPGDYAWSQVVGTVEIPGIRISDLDVYLAPTWRAAYVTISCLATNPGELTDRTNVRLSVEREGEIIESATRGVILAPGESKTISKTFTVPFPIGEYIARANGLAAPFTIII